MSHVRHVAAAVAVMACLTAPRAAVGAQAFRIIATDEGLEAPRTMLPGLRHIVFENRGTQIHEAMLVKLPPGMSAADFESELQAGVLFPPGALDYSGPGLTSAGEATELWLTVDPGAYVLVCWNHLRDSVRPMRVLDREQVDDAPPKEDVVLELRDFRFELRGRLTRGTQVIRVEMHGPSLHEADIFRLHPGRTAADVQRWYKDGLAGPAPADILGGVLDSHDVNRVVWLRRAFSPGRYVLHCGVPMNPDAKAGEHALTHADAGMVMTVEIDE